MSFLSLSVDVDLDKECVYMLGNSLGLQPKETMAMVDSELEKWRKKWGPFVCTCHAPFCLYTACLQGLATSLHIYFIHTEEYTVTHVDSSLGYP